MRIFLLSDSAAPHTRRWALWLASHKHEVHVVSLNARGLSNYDSVVVHSIGLSGSGNSLPERILKTPVVLWRLRQLFRRHSPDIVHAHSAGGYAWLAMLSGFRPYVVTPWGTDLLVDANRSKVNRLLTSQALRRSALVTTDGFHFVNVLGSLGVLPERILVHTFGTDVNLFSPGSDDGEREALKLGAALVIISTRTLNPVHDVETLIRAIPAIRSAYPDSKFVIVGDGAERESLEVLAASLQVTDATRFTGMVDEERIRRLLRSADVYVSTSLMDAGLAGSTAEAMATELPVVQTDNSDNAYWTPDGVGGFLVPNQDPGSLATAVCRLLGDDAIRRRMGDRNRSVINEQYNVDIEMARIEAVYWRIANNYEGRQ